MKGRWIMDVYMYEMVSQLRLHKDVVFVLLSMSLLQPKQRMCSNLTLRTTKPAYVRSYYRKERSHCPARCVLSTF